MQIPTACNGTAQPLPVPIPGANPLRPTFCGTSTNGPVAIGTVATQIAAFQRQYQRDYPFSLSVPNPNYVGSLLDQGVGYGLSPVMFDPRYRTPRAVEMNIGIQRELHPGGGRIELPGEIYFYDDPVAKLKTVTRQSVFVSVHGLPPMLLRTNNESRREMHTQMEDLRQKNRARGRTYDEQFALEQRSFIDSMADFARSFKNKLFTGKFEFWEYFAAQGYERYFQEWHRLTGKFADWEGLGVFFTSDDFYHLPIVRISSQLYAKLVTDSRPIEQGDSMDVKHLSMALPLAHFVLTDRKMANRIEELGINTEWNTKVFSESTIDNLFAELEKL